MKGFKDSNGKFHPIKNITKNEIIENNKEILKDPNIVKPNEIEPFGVREEINQVIKIVDSVGNTQNRKENLIQKSSYLMASISWIQPFVAGNKRTAYVTTKKFLRDNGYKFSIQTEQDKNDIIKLLNEIQNSRSELDPEILNAIIFYITKRIKKHD